MQKEKVNLNSTLITALGIIVVVLCAFYLISILYFTKQPSETSSDNTVAPAASSATELLLSTTDQDTATADKTNDYQYCEMFTSRFHKTRYDFARQKYESWDRYLDEGYTLDDITLAIEYFTNSNFSSKFRVKQLRLHSELTTDNNEINKSIVEEISDFLQFGIKASRAIPSAELANYALLSAKEQKKLLNDVTPNIDDLAYFIRQPEISDADVLELLDKVDNVRAIVGYGKLDTTSLLDYAVDSSRNKVAEKLLELGLEPTSDNYLASTMEWALSRLSYTKHTAKEESRAKLVLMLINYGAKARFKEQNLTKVSASFPRGSYSFNAEEVKGLMEDYGLDLTLIKSRETILVNKNSELVALLENKQASNLAEKLAIDNIDEQLSACKKTITAISNQWKPENAHAVMKRVIAENPGSPKDIKLRLAEIDPRLVDYYQTRFDGYLRRMEYMPELDQIFDPLKDGKVLLVIDALLDVPLNDSNKNWLFNQILQWDMSYYDELFNSELFIDELQYFDFTSPMLKPNSLKKLQEAGANLHDIDIRDKTLLYYAVKNVNVTLVNYMSEQQFPFSLSNIGEDPLHVALNTAYRKFSPNKFEALVDILMRYNPKIDQFHLNRLAVLKLKYPGLYQKIITKHPQLIIDESAVLPRII
jgi:hypothetical protein